MDAGFEILEHTADIGIRSWGPRIAECFEQAGWGLAEILGARAEPRDTGRGQAPAHSGEGAAVHTVTASGPDREALLVDFLNELLFLHETEEAAFASINVTRIDIGRGQAPAHSEVEAIVELAPIEGETETTGVKAATYHRLSVRERDGGFEARVYLDV